MGRRSLPEKRFSIRRSMRFGPVEAVIAAGALMTLIGFGILTAQAVRTTNQLVEAGQCVEALVTSTGEGGSLRLGKTATVSYETAGLRHVADLRYDGDRTLGRGASIRLCLASDTPETFAMDDGISIGQSTDLWLRQLIGSIGSALGFVALLVTLSLHEWRVHDADLD